MGHPSYPMISGHMLTDGAPACSTSANLRRRSTCSRAETDDGTPGMCFSPTTAVVVGAEADCETPGLGADGCGQPDRLTLAVGRLHSAEVSGQRSIERLDHRRRAGRRHRPVGTLGDAITTLSAGSDAAGVVVPVSAVTVVRPVLQHPTVGGCGAGFADTTPKPVTHACAALAHLVWKSARSTVTITPRADDKREGNPRDDG
jgi:hypothetical protein